MKYSFSLITLLLLATSLVYANQKVLDVPFLSFSAAGNGQTYNASLTSWNCTIRFWVKIENNPIGNEVELFRSDTNSIKVTNKYIYYQGSYQSYNKEFFFNDGKFHHYSIRMVSYPSNGYTPGYLKIDDQTIKIFPLKYQSFFNFTVNSFVIGDGLSNGVISDFTVYDYTMGYNDDFDLYEGDHLQNVTNHLVPQQNPPANQSSRITFTNPSNFDSQKYQYALFEDSYFKVDGTHMNTPQLSIVFYVQINQEYEDQWQPFVSAAKDSTNTNYLVLTNTNVWLNNKQYYIYGLQDKFKDNQWHQYVFTTDSNKFWVYLDNDLVATFDIIGSPFQFNTPSDGLFLGQDQDTFQGGFLSNEALYGGMSGFRIYNETFYPQHVMNAWLNKPVDGFLYRNDATYGIEHSNQFTQEVLNTPGHPLIQNDTSNHRFNDASPYAVFDDNHVAVSHQLQNGDATITFWAKLDLSHIADSRQTFLSISKVGKLNNIVIGSRDIFINNNNYVLDSYRTLIEDGQWHLFALAISSYQVKFFVDAQLIHSLKLDGNEGLLDNIPSNGIVLGQDQDSVGGSFDSNQAFYGELDSFKIYNTTFDAIQLTDLYRQDGSNPRFLVDKEIEEAGSTGIKFKVRENYLKEYVYTASNSGHQGPYIAFTDSYEAQGSATGDELTIIQHTDALGGYTISTVKNNATEYLGFDKNGADVVGNQSEYDALPAAFRWEIGFLSEEKVTFRIWQDNIPALQTAWNVTDLGDYTYMLTYLYRFQLSHQYTTQENDYTWFYLEKV